jgi:hypothetical protein
MNELGESVQGGGSLQFPGPPNGQVRRTKMSIPRTKRAATANLIVGIIDSSTAAITGVLAGVWRDAKLNRGIVNGMGPKGKNFEAMMASGSMVPSASHHEQGSDP